jgi:hypothetical protein
MTNQELLTAFDRTNLQEYAARATTIGDGWGRTHVPCPLYAIALDIDPKCPNLDSAIELLDMESTDLYAVTRDYDNALDGPVRKVSYATAREALVSALS